MLFIVTVEFAYTDSVALAVEAPDETQASDAAFMHFLEDAESDRPEATFTQTVESFESDFGQYEDGMFEKISA